MRMPVFKQILIAVCSFFLLLYACISIYSEFDPQLSDMLQKIMDEQTEKWPACISMGFTLPEQGTWIGVSGMVDQEAGIPVTKDNLFRVASITKTFVAATILKLMEENILALEDSVEHWLPGLVPNGDNITIRHLLNHTSGLYDCIEAQAESLKDPNRVWQPEELVAIATSKPPLFAPGERHAYCNAGYILLGMIIEAATDSTVEQEMRRLFLDPLQLNNTFLDGREEVPEELIIRADTDPDPFTAMAT